jgi:hypothetical protein
MAFENEGNGESIADLQKRMQEGLARLDPRLQELDQIRARQEEERAAREAQEIAAARERAWEAQIEAARERRKAAAGRLAQRIVAQVVPVSASGRAYGDVVEIRRCAGRRGNARWCRTGTILVFHPSS